MAYPGTAANNMTLFMPPGSPDATQKKFPRKNEALGAVQIITALIHLGLGGILLFSSKESVPLCMTAWYPFWGAGLFILSGSLSAAAATATNITEGLEAGSNMLNAISFLASSAGGVMLGLDLIHVSALNRHKVSIPILNKISSFSFDFLLPCEESPILLNYCQSLRSYKMGILALMMIFSVIEIIVSKAAISSDSDKPKTHKSEQVFPLLLPPQPQFSIGTNPAQL